MKCANCNNNAVFTVTNPATNPVNYCTVCLPVHLRTRATLGHFPLESSTVEEAPAVEAAPKKKSRKKAVRADS